MFKRIVVSGLTSVVCVLRCVVLCVVVCFLCITRFYVGKSSTGFLQIMTIGGFGIWVLIDLIMIVMGKFTNKEGKFITR